MTGHDVIALMFGGMDKLGPGDTASTLKALQHLPHNDFAMVVDAGCGTGRSSLVLAEALQVPIHAIETFTPFLDHLNTKAGDLGLDRYIITHNIDMADIPAHFSDIELLWSEAAAYSMGFGNALTSWHTVIRNGGFLVVSELGWNHDRPASAAKAFFAQEYPAMQTHADNMQLAEHSGYQLTDSFKLPDSSWVEGYYDVLKPRAQQWLEHEDATVSAYAELMLQEIEIFDNYSDQYSYAFYLLQRV